MVSLKQVLRSPKITCPQFGQSPNCKLSTRQQLSAKRTAVFQHLNSRYFSALLIFCLIFSLSYCSSPSGGGGKPALTGTVTLSNTAPQVGDTLIASYEDGNGTGEAAWQWLANGKSIPDANDTTYIVADADLEKTIAVSVSFADQDGTISSMATEAVAESTKSALTGTVAIDKTSPEVGDTLTAEYADGNGTGDRAWQWLADDVPIEGANSDTYTVTASELDKTLVARVSFADQSGSVSSEATALVTETTKPALTGTVTIDKTSPKVGDTLTAEYTGGNGTGTPSWQWLAGALAITDENSDTYEVTESVLGKTLAVRVSFTDQSGSIRSRSTFTVTVAPFTVTFDSNGGSTVSSQTVLPGRTAYRPMRPAKGSLYFCGWYTDNENFQNRWNFANPVNSNLTLYAQWSETLNNMDDIIELLSSNSGTKDNPLYLKLAIDLGLPSDPESNWRKLLAPLDGYWDHVAFDLSACTMTGNIFDHDNGYLGVDGMDSIVEITLPDVAASIGDRAFDSCRLLTKVVVPKATHIGERAFAGCNSLTEVDAPEVTSIGDDAFAWCGSLAKANIPKAKSIGDHAFYYCDSLAEVSFYEATSIGDAAFRGCDLLREVSFPKVISIGNVNSQVSPYEGAFDGCTSLTEVSFPKATSIDSDTFSGCRLLAEVSFPEAKSIGNGAFRNCTSLTKVSFPKVKSIGDRAFECCDLLRTITMGAVAPTVGRTTFYGVSGNPEVTVKIPTGATGYTVNWVNNFISGFTSGSTVRLIIEEIK